MAKVTLNVGGRTFVTYLETLKAYPTTMLGTMFSGRNVSLAKPEADGSYFFDRNGDLFSFILDYYRAGKVVYPTIVSKKDFDEELTFWGIIIPESAPAVSEIVDLDAILLYSMKAQHSGHEGRQNACLLLCRLAEAIRRSLKRGRRYCWLTHNIDTKDPVTKHLTNFFNLKKYEFLVLLAQKVNDTQVKFVFEGEVKTVKRQKAHRNGSGNLLVSILSCQF